MSVREYIGARYVPIFADPIQWDITKEYQPLTVVTDQGNSYVSRQAVPPGIQLDNTDYWILWADYNAQLQTYIQQVQLYNGRISTLEDDLPISDFSSNNTVKKYIDDAVDDVEDLLPASSFSSVNTVKKYIDDAVDDVEDFLPASSFSSVNTVKKYIDDKIGEITNKKIIYLGDSWLTIHDAHLVECINFYEKPTFFKNFAVSGATLQDITTQVATATADTSFENSSIDIVYIVGGTNNVYWDTPITWTEIKNVALGIVNAFPNAEIHYFPNNARTNNSGRTERYTNIVNGMAYEGIVVHPETLTLPFYGNFGSYLGTDQQGVQHLSTDGEWNFAFWCHTLRKGGNFAVYSIEFDVPLTFDASSSVTGTLTGKFKGDINSGILHIHASNLSLGSGHSSASPGNAQILLASSTNGSNITPIEIPSELYDYSYPCTENVVEHVVCAYAYSPRKFTVVLKSGVNPSTLDIVIPITNYINM